MIINNDESLQLISNTAFMIILILLILFVCISSPLIFNTDVKQNTCSSLTWLKDRLESMYWKYQELQWVFQGRYISGQKVYWAYELLVGELEGVEQALNV